MGAGQHVLELDLGETPLRMRRANRFPDLRDKRLATAWPALGMGACRGEHTGGKLRQTRALWALCRHGRSTFWRRDFAAGLLVRRGEPAQKPEPQHLDLGARGAHLLGAERRNEAGVGGKISRALQQLSGELAAVLGWERAGLPQRLAVPGRSLLGYERECGTQLRGRQRLTQR